MTEREDKRSSLGERTLLFTAGVVVHAAFGLLATVVTRWAFRSWPTGAYTWIPGLIGLAGVLVLVASAYVLAARSLPFAPVVAAWLVGRLAGAIAASALPGVGIDPALVASASFGLLVLDGGRLTIGAPQVVALLLQLAILSLAYRWGRRSAGGRSQTSGPE